MLAGICFVVHRCSPNEVVMSLIQACIKLTILPPGRGGGNKTKGLEMGKKIKGWKEETRPDTRPPVADGWAGAEVRVFPLFNSITSTD